MASESIIVEGSSSEVIARLKSLAGHKLHVAIDVVDEPKKAKKKALRKKSTLGSLLKFAGKWSGDDLEECLELVYKTRSQARF